MMPGKCEEEKTENIAKSCVLHVRKKQKQVYDCVLEC